MKKLIVLSVLILATAISYGQRKANLNVAKRGGQQLSLVSKEPCNPSKTLQINTGIDNDQSPVGMNVADPFWEGGFTNAGWSSYPDWLSLSTGGGATLTPTAGNLNSVGTFTMKRKFYVCKKTSLRFNGAFRYDNELISFKLLDPNNSTVWSYSGVAPQKPWFTDNQYSGFVNAIPGEYTFEFTYKNYGSVGGFSLKGGIMATAGNVLANYSNCCCNCDFLNDFKPEIVGEKCFCWSKECKTKLTFGLNSIPESDCTTYKWEVSPRVGFSGQGTGEISIDCRRLKPGQIYTITLYIECGGETVKVEHQLSVY